MAVKLIDAIVRHQLYLERLKAGQIVAYQIVARQIDDDIRKRLLGMNFATMDQMTKAQLRKLLMDLRITLNAHYSKYVESLIAFLRKFMAEDTDVMRAVFREFLPPGEDEPDIPDESKRWGIVGNAILPATGTLLLPFVRALTTYGTGSVMIRVQQGYANAEKVSDTLAALVGNDDVNFRAGTTNKTDNAARSVIATALQHVSANNEAQIAKIIWPRYKWVSVLDSVTTKICRSRDGNIYVYGEGPIPPAHPGCRSSTMPLVAGQDLDDMPTFAEWTRQQPASVLSAIFGTSRAPASNPAAIPLTLDRYAATRASILQG